jgi:hypothetical protein
VHGHRRSYYLLDFVVIITIAMAQILYRTQGAAVWRMTNLNSSVHILQPDMRAAAA